MIEDLPSVLYAAARWLGYLAVFLLAGAACGRWLVLPRADTPADGVAARRTIAAGRLGAVLLAAALLLRLYFQTRSLLDPEEPVTAEIVRLVLESHWGRGWIVQGAAALAALTGWRMLARAPASRAAATLALIGAVGSVFASPLTGHATGLPAAGRLGYPGTALHLAAAAAWLGTLGVLWYATLGRAADRNAHPAVVGAFSPLGLGAGLTAMAAGGIVAWRYVGSIDALTGSLYGRTLILKVVILGVVAFTGAVNWRVILPRLRRGEPAPIGRTAAIELLVGLVLLAVTAVLVSLAAPGEHE